jgi:Fe-S-cluster-containing dehydrogenase component/DMSO reductase anchor subunit
VRTFNELKVPGVEVVHLSMACNHCATAPCLEQCPARAYSRDEKTGAVLIDQDRCIGCRYCAWVCPYDAPRFNEALGVMTKCTFCVDRQQEGGQPSCTLSCPTDALSFAMRDPSELSQEVVGFAQAGTRPAMDIIELENSRLLPETHLPPAQPPWRLLWNKVSPRITFQHEWALAVFTLLIAVLTGLLAGHQAGRLELNWWVFLGLGLAGIVLSAAHLGQKTRAWRAALHLDRSWLSREIVASGLFLAVSTVGLMRIQLEGGSVLSLLAPLPSELSRWGLYLGLFTLFSIDTVYRVCTIRGSGLLHSALVFPTGLMLMGAAAGDAWVLVPLAMVKLVAFAARMRSRSSLGLGIVQTGAASRVLLLMGGTILVAANPAFSWAGFTALVCGEFLDRAQYYDELEVPTPASLMLNRLEETS